MQSPPLFSLRLLNCLLMSVLWNPNQFRRYTQCVWVHRFHKNCKNSEYTVEALTLPEMVLTIAALTHWFNSNEVSHRQRYHLRHSFRELTLKMRGKLSVIYSFVRQSGCQIRRKWGEITILTKDCLVLVGMALLSSDCKRCFPALFLCFGYEILVLGHLSDLLITNLVSDASILRYISCQNSPLVSFRFERVLWTTICPLHKVLLLCHCTYQLMDSIIFHVLTKKRQF